MFVNQTQKRNEQIKNDIDGNILHMEKSVDIFIKPASAK